MTDISDAADLTETARDALLRDLLSSLPGERRYTALMIANALAIAAREHRLGAAAVRSEAHRLQRLLADMGPLARPTEGADERDALPSLRKAVCASIRAGDFDESGRAAALAAALALTAEDRLAISNPKALHAQAPIRNASAQRAETP